jgi:VCPO second helical-bundle domain
MRTGDGRLTPIGTSSAFPHKAPGPGVWRLTPAAFAAPQTPWVGQVTPFVVPTADRFMPPPPPALDSAQWVADYNEIKSLGQNTSTTRSAAQTATAEFYLANVNRQFNRAVRDLAASRNLDLVQTARLAAMVNVVAADAGISGMDAKYAYLFWRPITAIDPSAVTNDGFGPVPGFDDGNPLTVPQPGWRPLLATPNHPEYPSAHCTLTSAMAEVFAQFLGTNRFNLTLRGFDLHGAAGNFDAVRTFARANDLRAEIVDARVWAGLHYRSSDVAGVALGRSVAKYDLNHAFQPLP